MIKNVLIFTLMQKYVRGKIYDLRKAGGGERISIILNVKYRPLPAWLTTLS